MNASSAARFASRLQTSAASIFPAIIRYDDQCYEAGSSGLQRGYEPGSGEGHPTRRISFWLRLSAFELASKPVPSENTPLYSRPRDGDPETWSEYNIDHVGVDPTNTTLVIECVAQPS